MAQDRLHGLEVVGGKRALQLVAGQPCVPVGRGQLAAEQLAAEEENLEGERVLGKGRERERKAGEGRSGEGKSECRGARVWLTGRELASAGLNTAAGA